MTRVAQVLIVSLSLISAAPARAQRTPATTTADFGWLVGQWEGRLTGSPSALVEVTYSKPNARSIVGVMRLVSYDKALMSTQLRTTTIVRQGADGFIGRSNIIGSDGAPAVVEVTYARAR